MTFHARAAGDEKNNALPTSDDILESAEGSAREAAGWSYHSHLRRGRMFIFRGHIILVRGDEADRLRAELATATAALLVWARTETGGPTPPDQVRTTQE